MAYLQPAGLGASLGGALFVVGGKVGVGSPTALPFTPSGYLEVQSKDTAVSAFDVRTNTGHADGMKSRFAVENNANNESVDINFRMCVINCGSTSALTSAPVTLRFDSPTGSSYSPIQVYKPGSTTLNTFLVNGNGTVTIAALGEASLALKVNRIGDANDTFRIQADGIFDWGAGGASGVDVNLYRSAANILATDDDFAVKLAGKGLRIAEGANAKMGAVALSAGAATVSTTAVTANSRILLASQLDGGTPGFLRVVSRVAATSFLINSSNGADTSTVAWFIVEPA